MFIEPNILGHKRGCIEVICGGMFSGKTEELIRRLKRAKIANQRIKIFKPQIDNRYSKEHIISHNLNNIRAAVIDNASDMLPQVADIDVIGIDEVQFLDSKIVEVVETLVHQNYRVVLAGLDMDYTGKPFGSMPALLSIADFITKLHAICVQCGNIANMSHRKQASTEQILIGEQNVYEPLCRSCFYAVQQ